MGKIDRDGKKLKLTVFLIKEGYQKIDDFLENGSLMSASVSSHGTEGTLFYRGGFRTEPPWVSLFKDVPGFDATQIFNEGSRAIFVTRVVRRWFCFTFGHTRHLIAEGAIERNFGLIVALNLGDPEAIKAIDKTNISHVALQSREQAGRDVGFDGFEFDTEIDLLKSVTAKGLSVDGEEQETYSGRDSISVYTRVDISRLSEIAKELYKAFESTAYLDRYPWVGKITQERDPSLVIQLDAAAVSTINHGDFTKIWLAVPEVIAWEDVDGFAFRMLSNNPRKAGPAVYPDVDLKDWLAERKLNGKVTLAHLQNQRVYQCFKDERAPVTWSIYRCLNAEIDLRGEKFVLNDGDWYHIDSDFVTDVDTFYHGIAASKLQLPNFGTMKEPEYLKTVSKTTATLALMDRKMILIGGGRSRIEFCDLFSRNGDIIHVKYYGGSALLSHLFSQAVVSADCFLHEVEFRRKLNNHLPNGFKLNNPMAAPTAEDYTVCMAIMSKVPGPLEIPFFSKVSMKHAVRLIQKMNYHVTKLKVAR